MRNRAEGKVIRPCASRTRKTRVIVVVVGAAALGTVFGRVRRHEWHHQAFAFGGTSDIPDMPSFITSVPRAIRQVDARPIPSPHQAGDRLRA